VTDTTGSCSVTSAKLTNGTQSVTLTITGVTHPTATYNASANVASSITVNK
jgi:hypothetical protein